MQKGLAGVTLQAPSCPAPQRLLRRPRPRTALQAATRRQQARVQAAAADFPADFPPDQPTAAERLRAAAAAAAQWRREQAERQLAEAARQQPAAEPNSSNGRAHLPSSLFAAFPQHKLPPDGSTLTPEELKCDPDVELCRTRIHVWESRCTACYGTGVQRSYGGGGSSRHRQGGHHHHHGGHRLLSTCLLCSGLGYVRHTSTHSAPRVSGTGPHTTIGRPPPPEVKKVRVPGFFKQ